MARRWTLFPQNTDQTRFLADRLKVHPVVAALLINRGVETHEQGRRFLERGLGGLHDPEQHPGIPAAADRIHAAVQAGKRICIYGDYDVDGMCASAILTECLRIGGATPSYYVPDRFEEGYGVHSDALKRLKESGVDLVVTVDCGIGSVQQARDARELGLEYIVTDHHEIGAEVPPADVVCHPRLPGSAYPFGELCGTGVAFKLAWEVARRFSGARKTTAAFQQFLLNATTLAAIGTICDIVPLTDENRVLVHHGLQTLKKSPSVGLGQLLRIAGLAEKDRLNTGQIAFALGPRLNACGRLGEARLGIELLTTSDADRARQLAEHLDHSNQSRQTLENRIYREAKEQAKDDFAADTDALPAALVLAGESSRWHPGVVGIVASRVVERFHRPTVMLTFTGDEGTGSARSVPGFHLHEALAECSDLLLACGGHAMAAGLRIRRENLAEFRDRFVQLASDRLAEEHRTAELRVDAEVPLHVLTPALLNALEVLEPFGMRNPSPLLLATNLMVVGEPKKVGGGERHLSFRVQQNGKTMRAIAFGQGDRHEELLQAENRCCLVFSPIKNDFRGYPEVELEVKDLRPGSQVHDTVPS